MSKNSNIGSVKANELKDLCFLCAELLDYLLFKVQKYQQS